MSYATQEQLVNFVNLFDTSFTEDDITSTQILWDMATADVNSAIHSKGINPSDIEDIDNLLAMSEICFYMELASMNGRVEARYGDITQESVGKYTKKYSPTQPMFFFAQGEAEGFLRLLPHETWKMRAMRFVFRFIQAHYNTNGKPSNIYGKVIQDDTIRGRGWDNEVTDQKSEYDDYYGRPTRL